MSRQMLLTVTQVEPLTPLITRFRFEHPDGASLPLFSGGAHVTVEMPDGDTLRRNAYSLISDPHDGSGYEIAVRRDDAGRGGSRFMHQRVTPGMQMRVSPPLNLFALNPRARKHVLIAGGIGITPFLSHIRQLTRLTLSFELHYAVRSTANAAGLPLLPPGTPVQLYPSADGTRMNLTALLEAQPLGTNIYVCGPDALITAVMDTGAQLGWPRSALHAEAFSAPPPGQPFRVTLASTGAEITVGAHQSLLEALEAAQVNLDWSCRGGACGRCQTGVRECHGRIEHHDHWLSPDERAAQTKIMPCMSRFTGDRLVLDL